MAKIGCKWTCLTDLAEVVPSLRENVAANPLLQGVEVQPLAWGTNDWQDVTRKQCPDLVLVADCVYWPELFQPLADTIESLCIHCRATVLIAHTRRWKRDGRSFK